MIPTDRGPMDADAILDHLTYKNYAHNRRLSPHLTVEQWTKVFPNAARLEARFQAELAIAKAAA